MAGDTQPLRMPKRKARWRDIGTFTISMVVVCGFIAYAFAVTFWDSAPTADKTQIGNLQVVLATAFAGAVGYWIGSSLGSAVKSDELAKK
jgi:hypothetical protein